jgi:hypothetical protein
MYTTKQGAIPDNMTSYIARRNGKCKHASGFDGTAFVLVRASNHMNIYNLLCLPSLSSVDGRLPLPPGCVCVYICTYSVTVGLQPHTKNRGMAHASKSIFIVCACTLNAMV